MFAIIAIRLAMLGKTANKEIIKIVHYVRKKAISKILIYLFILVKLNVK